VPAVLSGGAPQERWQRMFDSMLDADRLILMRHPGNGGPLAKQLRYHWMPAQEYGGGALDGRERQVVLAQPFLRHFLHQALAKAGRRDDLVASLRRWQPLPDRGNNVFEEYRGHMPGHGSRCHAWSATPTVDLTTHVRGVRRIGVGVVDGRGRAVLRGTVAARRRRAHAVRADPARTYPRGRRLGRPTAGRHRHPASARQRPRSAVGKNLLAW